MVPANNNFETIDFSGTNLQKTNIPPGSASKRNIISNGNPQKGHRKLLILACAIILIIAAAAFLGGGNSRPKKIEAPPGSVIIYPKDAPPRLEKKP